MDVAKEFDDYMAYLMRALGHVDMALRIDWLLHRSDAAVVAQERRAHCSASLPLARQRQTLVAVPFCR